MFILLLTYKKTLDAVEANLEAHRAYLEKYYTQGKFICSGRRNPRTGGMILCKAENEAEVRHMIEDDPFYYNQIADYEIIDVVPTKYVAGFEKFI